MCELPSGVTLAAFTAEELWRIWREMAPHPQLFGDDWMRDPEVFMKVLLAPDSVTLRVETGFVFLLRVQRGLRAEVHVWFPDHKLSPRRELLKELLLWGFLEFDLQRLETFVPSTSRPIKRFLRERLGFQYEGTMRRRRWNAGRLIDIEIFALLREEVSLGE